MLPPLAQIGGPLGAAQRLQAIASKVDVETVKRTIEQHYGFVPSDDYCSDFVEFVMAMVLEPDGGNREPRK